MRFKRWLRKIWCYFKYYIYLPIWNYVYYPFLNSFRKVSRSWWKLNWWLIASFWDFIGLLESSPAIISAVTVGWFMAFNSFILSLNITSVISGVLSSFFNVYFFFINFRSLLIAYIAYDYFSMRLIDMVADPDLSMWNLCMLTIFYNVLYMLMDGADSKLTFESHDFLTSLYVSNVLGQHVMNLVTEDQLKDNVLSSYLSISFKSNAILCVLGFLYSGQPLFSGSQ